MNDYVSALGYRPPGVSLRYLGAYLAYLATLLRGLAAVGAGLGSGIALPPLLAYGLLLLAEPWLTRRRGWRPWAYLAVQFAITLLLFVLFPGLDFVAILFIPLSLQAVLLLGRRNGFLWIGAFALCAAGPASAESGLLLPGLTMALFYGATYFLMGYFAHVMRRAEAARDENQRLIGDLRTAHRRLQAYAAEVEGFAAARERGRMARELHDSVTQTIFGMNLSVQSARLLAANDPAAAARELERVQTLARSATGELQALVSQLQPRGPGEASWPNTGAPADLPAALRRLAAEREEREGLKVVLTVAGERVLPVPVARSLFRVAQEAINNVSKHAGTDEAAVRLDLASERASLEVVDEGVGFDPDTVGGDAGHLGLAGMAQRAREIGWRFQCDSRPGVGTRVRVEEG